MLKVEWIDFQRAAKEPPHPGYPNGKDIDVAQKTHKTCSTALPYPAKRCGMYVVGCDVCGQIVTVTTAGRADDPRSLKLACKH